MAIFKNEERDAIKSSILNYLIHCNEEVDTDIIVDKINLFLQEEEKYRTTKKLGKYSTKVLVSTGFANTIEGGADIWTNHFIEYVWNSILLYC